MIRGLNQSMAWVIAFVMAVTVFAVLGFLLMAVKARNSGGDGHKTAIHSSKEAHESEEAAPNVLRAAPPQHDKEADKPQASSHDVHEEGHESQGEAAHHQQGDSEEDHMQAKPVPEEQHSDAVESGSPEKPDAIRDSKKKIRTF